LGDKVRARGQRTEDRGRCREKTGGTVGIGARARQAVRGVRRRVERGGSASRTKARVRGRNELELLLSADLGRDKAGGSAALVGDHVGRWHDTAGGGGGLGPAATAIGSGAADVVDFLVGRACGERYSAGGPCGGGPRAGLNHRWAALYTEAGLV
jgi:hypothetical protein